ncbi:hypothetical protein [Chitinivorax sp. B]|uniref:hypothetical protein n=1 Tax=Chitinivorax sp. B TaxID=2502235 RepID=UPI0010F75B60|nr:hypothetical protein [Chitinivorax sp. B]
MNTKVMVGAGVIVVVLMSGLWIQKERAQARRLALAEQAETAQREAEEARQNAAMQIAEVEVNSIAAEQARGAAAAEQLKKLREDADREYSSARNESHRNQYAYEAQKRREKYEQEYAEMKRRSADERLKAHERQKADEALRELNRQIAEAKMAEEREKRIRPSVGTVTCGSSDPHCDK